jgi:hypothetical protein
MSLADPRLEQGVLHRQLEHEAAQLALVEPPDAAGQRLVRHVGEPVLPRIRAVGQEPLDHEAPEPLPCLLLLHLGDDQRERLAGGSRTESASFRLLFLLPAVILRVFRRRPPGTLKVQDAEPLHLTRGALLTAWR